MNTISSLETTDLPAAFHIEQRAHTFPWSEKTFASNQGERYLNFQLTQNGKMAAFAITQVVLDEATLFNIAVDPDYQRQGLGRALLDDAPRDKCVHFREINGIAAAFQYLQK
ncbi:GNAT family N-acetyltransferase, partial [Escherichia coli]|uniref:GNAT family N-acetyltransferase n=1 Tax=Escherichia coli TaxID=562 RepID=UPI000A5D6C53